MFLITCPVYHNRNTKILQLLLNFRSMHNHHIFNNKITSTRKNQFIIRRIIFTCIYNIALFHQLWNLWQIPSILLCSRKSYPVQCINRTKHIHSRRCHQINIIYWLLHCLNILIQIFRYLFILRHNQKTAAIWYRNQIIAVTIIIYRILRSILQIHPAFISQSGTDLLVHLNLLRLRRIPSWTLRTPNQL